VKLTSDVQNKSALAVLTYKPVQIKPEMTFTGLLYAGPKSIDILKAVDPEMASLIDLGFFGFIAKPLLYVMKAFHSWVGNWGFAIILLTLLVRLCVLPFNIMSFKSMKAMQRVQPIIQALREKHKDDPMRLNTEMMAVMKQNGANPIGGCLPMVLQIPVFFALYRVIGSSIELYNSPFILWITDLSAHDKFYVLPVSMAIFMYIQQKITPSTMDPTQAKIMAFLPLVFSLFMLQLPSGLCLYMVVSTLFGITQQYLIMRDKTSPPAPVGPLKTVKGKG
jgi:YidC/Oxa1 family membrane protein insertase